MGGCDCRTLVPVTAAVGAAALGYASDSRAELVRPAQVRDSRTAARHRAAARAAHLRRSPDPGPQAACMSWIRSLDDLDPHLVVNTGDSIAHPQSVRVFLDSLGPLLDRPGRVRATAPTTCTHPSRRIRRATCGAELPPAPEEGARPALGEAPGRHDRGRLAGPEQPAGPARRRAASTSRWPGSTTRTSSETVTSRWRGAPTRRRPAPRRPALTRTAVARPVRGRRLRPAAGRAHPRRPALPAVVRHPGHQLRDRPEAGPRAAPLSRRRARPGCTYPPGWARRLGLRPGSPAAPKPACSPWCHAIPAEPARLPAPGRFLVLSQARASPRFR